MFHGDTAELTRTLGAAVGHGRTMQHRRIGSEHLLLALCESAGAAGRPFVWPGPLRPRCHR